MPAGNLFQPFQVVNNVRARGLADRVRRNSKDLRLRDPFDWLQGWHTRPDLRSLPGVSLGTRVDMVASRAPIRRHWLAAVGTWRADRGRWNGPQTSTSSGRISARLPRRDSKRAPCEAAGNRNDQAGRASYDSFRGNASKPPPRNERPWLLIRFPTAASP